MVRHTRRQEWSDKLEDWSDLDKKSICLSIDFACHYPKYKSKLYVVKLTPMIHFFILMSLTFVKDHSHNFYNSDINSDNILINELSKMLGKIYEDFYYQL